MSTTNDLIVSGSSVLLCLIFLDAAVWELQARTREHRRTRRPHTPACKVAIKLFRQPSPLFFFQLLDPVSKCCHCSAPVASPAPPIDFPHRIPQERAEIQFPNN
jgi:hypothetical protein